MLDQERLDALRTVKGRMLSDILDDQPPPFLFENCFRQQSISVLIAPAHKGKTLLMLEMAICLDMELPLFGRFQPVPGREVFFIGADAASWDYNLQTRRLCLGHGISAAQRRLMSVAGVWRRGIKVTDPSVLTWLEAWKSQTGADVLFIDSHRATHDADENDSREMGKVWDCICRLRDSGWTIIMAHHSGKMKEGVFQDESHSGRGSTIINDQSDFIFTLSKRKRRDKKVHVICNKARGSADLEDTFNHFVINDVPETSEAVAGRLVRGLRLDLESDPMWDWLQVVMGVKDRPANTSCRPYTLAEIMEQLARAKLGDADENWTLLRLYELRAMGKVREIGGRWIGV